MNAAIGLLSFGPISGVIGTQKGGCREKNTQAARMSLKRTASSQDSAETKPAKRGSKPLDNWLSVSLPKPPAIWARSDPLNDEDSTFLAWAASAESTQDIVKLRNYVLEVGNPNFRHDPPSHTAHGAVSCHFSAGLVYF